MLTKKEIEKYFNTEKQESLLFLVIGIAGVIAGIVFFFFLKTNFYKGAAIPFFLIGLLLGIVGYVVYGRSDNDRKRNVYAYDMNPTALKDKELPRMTSVMKNFVIYRYSEIFLAAAGIVMFYYFRNNITQQFWKGFGLALTIMGILALAADFFAEKRGRAYVNGIESFVSK
ncbi:MAG: hypothetical protein WBC06_10660 [Chitinophagaceae bacterium]